MLVKEVKHGGEDYQLLLAVPPENVESVRELAVVWDVAVNVIGEFAQGAPGVSLKFGERLSPLAPAGHDAFRTPPTPSSQPQE